MAVHAMESCTFLWGFTMPNPMQELWPWTQSQTAS